MTSEKRFLTTGDIVAEFGVSVRTVKYWRNRDGLRHFRQGNVVLVDRKDLEKFIRARTMGG